MSGNGSERGEAKVEAGRAGGVEQSGDRLNVRQQVWTE